MSRGGEHGDLFSNSEHGSTKCDQNLAEYDPSDRLARSSEVNHQTFTEEEERYTTDEKPLESTSSSDQETNGEQPDSSDDVVDGRDVSGLGDRDVEDDLEEGGEVARPAVVCDLPGNVEHTST